MPSTPTDNNDPTPETPSTTSKPPKTWQGVVPDCVGIVTVGSLVGLDKVNPVAGLLLIALILSIRWPMKGGSALLTAVWPVVSLFRGTGSN